MDPIWLGNSLRSNTSCNFSPFFVFCLSSLCVCLFIVNMCMWKVGRQSFAIQYTQVSCNRLLGIPPTPECLWTTTTTSSPRQVTTTTSSPRQVDDGGSKHASYQKDDHFSGVDVGDLDVRCDRLDCSDRETFDTGVGTHHCRRQS